MKKKSKEFVEVNIKGQLGMLRPTKAFKEIDRALIKADTLNKFFNILFDYMHTPQEKTFVATEYGQTTGLPIVGKWKVRQDSKEQYFKFSDNLRTRLKIGGEVFKFLSENVPQKGVHMMKLTKGILLFDRRPIATGGDHFSTDYKIMVVATPMISCSTFVTVGGEDASS